MLSTTDFFMHITPGILLTFFGTWWLVLIASWTSIRRRLLLRKVYDDEDKSWKKLLKSGKFDKCSLPLPCRLFQIISLEGIMKLAASITGIIVVIVLHVKSIAGIQCTTIYLFFGLSGFADIVSCFDAAPPGIDYYLLSLAFSVEAGVIYSHSTGPDSFAEICQSVQVVLAILCAVSTLIEMKTRRNFSWRLVRTYLTLAQGVWCIQAGIFFQMEYFSWVRADRENHLVWIGIAVSWIFGVIFFYAFIVYVIVYAIARRCWCCRLSSIAKEPRDSNSNIYKRSLSNDDDEINCLAEDF